MVEKYKKVGPFLLRCGDFLINIKQRTCNCRWFLKKGVCCHILGYCYKTSSVDIQSWFGPKYTGEPNIFAFNTKRGAKPKKGCYKRSEKALDPY